MRVQAVSREGGRKGGGRRFVGVVVGVVDAGGGRDGGLQAHEGRGIRRVCSGNWRAGKLQTGRLWRRRRGVVDNEVETDRGPKGNIDNRVCGEYKRRWEERGSLSSANFLL